MLDKNLMPEIRKELDEYKKFAFNKNLIAMALTLISAQIVQKFVTSISESLLMPVINYFVSIANTGNWRSLILCPVDGMNLEIGNFCASFLEFSITMVVLYAVYTKIVKRFAPDVEIDCKK